MRKAVVVMLALIAFLPTCTVQRVSTRYACYLPVVTASEKSKKGVALYPGSPCADVQAVDARWQYGWWPQPAQCKDVENVPMVSCGIDALKLVNGTVSIGGNSEWFMLFNEPDLTLSITPEEGAILYQRMEPLLVDRRIVAPAPSELYIEWLPQFRQAYHDAHGKRPRLDALAVHCYKQSAAECKVLVEQFITWANEWQIGEVWVTEFSFMNLTEARKFIAWMEHEPAITRYAWYTNRLPATHINDAPLINWHTGELTGWGVMYAEMGQR